MKSVCPPLVAALFATCSAAALSLAGCSSESAASPAVAVAIQPSSAPVATTPEPPPATAAAAEPAPEIQLTAAEAPAASASEEKPNDENPTPRVNRPPPADRAPRKPGDAEKITFEDLILGMQADVVFRPFMLTDRAKELEGQRVSISGYMHGGVSSTKANQEFILLRNTECKFGKGGQADHLAQIYLRKGTTAEFTGEAVKVEGDLKIEPFNGPDGNTWAIYQLEDAQIK
jgi:hypothetical protein